jgi:DNA-binding XRE family transcriptional regulator
MKHPAGKTVQELHTKWRKDTAYRKAYEALEEEFGVAEALTTARTHAGLTQERLAEIMGTKQSSVSRLEAGAKDPRLSTLGVYAAATGVEFRIMPRAGGYRITMSSGGRAIRRDAVTGRPVKHGARKPATGKKA